MKTSNLANEAVRQSDVGMVWEEKLSGAAGTLTLLPFQAFRVRAAAGGTVTIDGVLAATMISGEILVFNAGGGQPALTSALTTGVVLRQAPSVVVVIAGNQFVQVARETTRRV
jgi:hypothetical protein